MPETLGFTSRREGQVGILETDGYINNAEAERVADAGHAMIEYGLTHLVINIESSRISSSIGISVLIELIEWLRQMEGKIAFWCATPTVAKTLKVMALLKVDEIHDTEEERALPEEVTARGPESVPDPPAHAYPCPAGHTVWRGFILAGGTVRTALSHAPIEETH